MDSPQFHVHAQIEQSHWWFLGRRAIVTTLLHEALPPSKETLLIDVGCGTGGMTAHFSKEYRCIGIDPITEAIAFAKRKFPQCDFRVGEAPKDIREEYGKADGILLLDVLEHVEHDHRFMHDLITAMKPGAFLLLVAPADPALHGQHDIGFGHFRRFDAARIRELWKDLPVEERFLSYCNSRLYWPIRFARALSRIRKKSWGPSDTDLSTPTAPINTMLMQIFGGEASPIVHALRKKQKFPYRRGVSMVGILQK